jgi:hypothetical protein
MDTTSYGHRMHARSEFQAKFKPGLVALEATYVVMPPEMKSRRYRFDTPMSPDQAEQVARDLLEAAAAARKV